jgi:hypothetical protein
MPLDRRGRGAYPGWSSPVSGIAPTSAIIGRTASTGPFLRARLEVGNRVEHPPDDLCTFGLTQKQVRAG